MKRILLIIALFASVSWGTVNDANTIQMFACNGSVVDFTFTFACFDDDDLAVYLRDGNDTETTLTKTTDWSATAGGNDDWTDGGVVTTVATYASGNTIVVKQNIAQDQDYDIPSRINPKSLEAVLDKIVLLIQAVSDIVNGYTIRAPITDNSSALVLPTSSDRANKWLVFDANGDVALTDTDGTLFGSGSWDINDLNAVDLIVTGSATIGELSATLTSPIINVGVSGTAIDTDPNLAANSDTLLSSQKAIKAHVASATVTMTNKTLTSPVINTGVSGTAIDATTTLGTSDTKVPTQKAVKTYTDSGTQTMTNKTLTSPVLNTGVSGTAVDTDTTLAANSDTKVASQKAVKAYVDAISPGAWTPSTYAGEQSVTFPNGLIMKMGYAAFVAGSVTITFDVAFGTLVYVNATPYDVSTTVDADYMAIQAKSTSAITIKTRNSVFTNVYWQAIGY